MKFPDVTVADWRAQVDKELLGASFDKTLVFKTAEGLSIQPLYTEAKGSPDLASSAVSSDASAPSFRICTRLEADAEDSAAELAEDLEGGADAVWASLTSDTGLDAALAKIDTKRTFLVLDAPNALHADVAARLAKMGFDAQLHVVLGHDPIAAVARGQAKAEGLTEALGKLGAGARSFEERYPNAAAVLVSTLPYHDAGADAADEIAIALSTGAAYLGALLDPGLEPSAAAKTIALQITSGRDTFVELAKLRALRICWQKLLVASGAESAPRTLVHAVCSSRTLTQRDPWVNMLRGTTQVFAAVLGGADLVTPSAFDQALGPASALGRRVARNTGLVLREESWLGKVKDPAGGSYYLETLTDELARDAWKRFQALEKDGGIAEALTSGKLVARLTEAWKQRLDLVAKRKSAILGISEFANLDERLPKPATNEALATAPNALPLRREAEPFEHLRARAEAITPAPTALLVTLGSLSESRPRAGFAANFFTAGGIRTRESTTDENVAIACLCGSDERYAAEAVDRVRALKSLGCKHIVVAGRPGALEASLREAGVDGFIYVGCDAVSTLSELLDVLS